MKHAILAVLTQGAAYGLQIRNELERRLDRDRAINVGQVYSTIERLVRDGFVEVTSQTSDGLPLYSLTRDGATRAEAWLTRPAEDQHRPWDTMIAQVLMARSLPGRDGSPLVRAYEELWRARAEKAAKQLTLGGQSRLLLANAALGWLARVEEAEDASFPIATERPRRGRPRL